MKRSHKGIFTIPEMIRRGAEEFGTRPALIKRTPRGDEVTTYEGLFHEVTLVAKGLADLGVRPGDKVAILGHNSPEWAKAYLGTSQASAICVPIDSLLTQNEITHLLADSKAKVAFVTTRFLDMVLDSHLGLRSLRHLIVMDWEDGEPPGRAIPWEDFLKKGELGPGLKGGPELESLAAIIYTSGTTGRPKGVMLTHKNIVSDCAACYQAVYIGQERFLSVLPMHHTFECTAGFLLPLYSGCSITFARSLKSKYIIEDLKASRATVMLGVPLLFQKMLDGIKRGIEKASPGKKLAFNALMKVVKAGEKTGRHHLGKIFFKGLREKAGLGHLRFFIVGGAPVRPQIPRDFRRLGIMMLQGYGLTEASPVLTLNPEDAPKDNSIGRPLPGVEVKVIDPDEKGVGELAFRGPMIMKGYYNNPKATKEVLTEDGWLLTGDLGWIDQNGYCFISGRGKNLIVTPAGKNVYPEEIEAILCESPHILEAMVYGRPLPTGGEEVRALIVPDYETIGKLYKGPLSESKINGLISKDVKRTNKVLAGYKRIKSFQIRDEEFPKTSTRKIKRHLIQVT